LIGLDQRIDRFVVHHRAEPFDTIFVWLSRMGTYGLVWIAIAAVIAFFWKRPFALPLTLCAIVLAEATTELGKALIHRDRPGLHYAEPRPLVFLPHTHSFPSGHAAASFACAATLARFTSRGVAIALFVLAALIAWSRVYVGVHYPLDVLVGALIGLAIATALRLLPADPRRSRRAPPAG
jgi:undecaprenyl-diphosphatase